MEDEPPIYSIELYGGPWDGADNMKISAIVKKIYVDKESYVFFYPHPADLGLEKAARRYVYRHWTINA